MTTHLLPTAGAATRIVFIRHGEPDAAFQGRCYGRSDPGLSPRGHEQMRRAWRLLSGEPVTAICCSPSRRALESARSNGIVGLGISVDTRLREIDFGQFEGLTYDDVARQFPEKYREWMTRPTDVLFPGGESFQAMSIRVLEAIKDIRRLNPAGTVVTVSHGGVNRIALAAALDLDPRRIFRLDQAYASLNVIDYFGDEPLVRVINAVAPSPC